MKAAGNPAVFFYVNTRLKISRVNTSNKRRFVIPCIAIGIAAFLFLNRESDSIVGQNEPTPVEQLQHPMSGSEEDEEPAALTMADVLEMAIDARAHMAEHLDDYTAKFVKQERGDDGLLGEESVIQMKVQTRLRGDTEDAPMRVYLDFQAPAAKKGRKVIWAQDLYDGKMVVHEVGMLLGLKRIWLDPNGVLAMQGQRYPISQIGMVRLVEKLIERGEKDRNNPDIQVVLTKDYKFDGRSTELIQVRRGEPTEDEEDFSLAEIVIDKERQLILLYRSFGWSDNNEGSAPMIESYSYQDVETNVGLTDEDFSPDNPAYNFPAF